VFLLSWNKTRSFAIQPTSRQFSVGFKIRFVSFDWNGEKPFFY